MPTIMIFWLMFILSPRPMQQSVESIAAVEPQTESPLMVSPEESGLMGTYATFHAPGTGIVVNPAKSETAAFVTLKASPDSKLNGWIYSDMKLISDETVGDENSGNSSRTRIFASQAKQSVRVFLRYQIVTESALTIDGVPQRAAQTHYSASIYRIRGEFEVVYHKTFRATVDR